MSKSRRLQHLFALLTISAVALVGPAAVGGATADARSSTTTLASSALAATSTTTTTARKPRWRPEQGAFFNAPRGAAADEFNLHTRIREAIDHAKPGSYIRIAAFSFDRTYIADRLIAAYRRGVHVQILLNDHQITPAQVRLHRVLGKNRNHLSFIYECTHGCRGTGDILHTKFYTFSHTGGAEWVSMVGSVNLTMNSVENQYNDMYVQDDQYKLFRAFKRLFKNMKLDKVQNPGYWIQRVSPDWELQATPYHPKTAASDPIMRILDRVKCTGALSPDGQPVPTTVRVDMHTWNGARGVYIAQKLRSLFAAGCDVRVMWGWGGKLVRETFAKATPRGYVPAHSNGMDTNDDGLIDLYTHQKELIISGHYGTNPTKTLVVTGSSNYTADGLTGDEIIFLIANERGTLGEYLANFNWEWNERSRIVGNSPFRTRVGTPTNDGARFGPAWEQD